MSDLRERTWTSSGSKSRWQTLHRSMRSRTMRLICLSVSMPVAFVGGTIPQVLVARFALEVVQVERVDEVPEDRELFFVDGFGPLKLWMRGRLPVVVVIGAKHDAGLLHDGVFDEDGDPRADGEGDGVTGAGVDLDFAPVLAQDDAGVEDIVGEVGDGDPLHGPAHVVDDGPHQVVRERARGGDALQLHGDRFRLIGSDPDWQVALPVDLLEDDDAVLGHQADSDAFDHRLDHAKPSGRKKWAGEERKITRAVCPARLAGPRGSLQPGLRPGQCLPL